MSSLMSSLGIDRLSPKERMQLIREIADSLVEEGVPPPLTEAQRQELDRRLAILEANSGKVISWDEAEVAQEPFRLA